MKMKQLSIVDCRSRVSRRMLRGLAVAALFSSVFFPGSPVYAACTDPAGVEGDMVYNTTHDVMMFCDGSDDWISMVGGGGVTDGDKGDVTVSASGAVWTVDNDAVTYAKLQNVSATNRLLGRATAGAGDVEELTIGSGLTLTGTTLSASAGSSSNGVAGSVQFSGGSGAFLSDATNLFWNDTNNFLGIGTNAPGDRLYVHSASSSGALVSTAGDAATEQSYLGLLTSSDGANTYTAATKGWQLYARGNTYGGSNANDFGIGYWNGSTWSNPFYIDSATGNVGMGGVVDPVAKVDVTGSLIKSQSVELDDQWGRVNWNVYWDNGISNWKYRTAGYGANLQMEGSTGRLDFVTYPSGAADATPGSQTYAMTILPTGMVGMGDTTPDGTLKLDVEGQVGASEYCDQNGANCVAAGSMGGAPSGMLCGLAYRATTTACTSGSGFSSIATCNGSSIASACPTGYTQRTIRTGYFNSGGDEGFYCARTCSKD